MTILRSLFRGVRALLWALLSFLLAPFSALRKPKRLLTRQEKRAMARRMANDNARRYVIGLPASERWKWSRKRRRSLARIVAKAYFWQLRGATV